jgi:hypothetical protein
MSGYGNGLEKWILHPGLGGPFAALLDEMARASEDFCRTVEKVPAELFVRERPSEDPDTVSVRAVCAHVIRAAYGHVNYIRRARRMEVLSPLPPERYGPEGPQDVRLLLHEALLYVEAGLEGLAEVPEAEVAAMTFPARWGPTYDPEMMMEHAVLHLLRHRRQLERWPGGLGG